MRYRVHVDLRKDDVAKRAGVDDLLQHSHRLVVAHVLVDREHLAGHPGLVAQLDRLVERKRQRLLRQYAFDVLAFSVRGG